MGLQGGSGKGTRTGLATGGAREQLGRAGGDAVWGVARRQILVRWMGQCRVTGRLGRNRTGSSLSLRPDPAQACRSAQACRRSPCPCHPHVTRTAQPKHLWLPQQSMTPCQRSPCPRHPHVTRTAQPKHLWLPQQSMTPCQRSPYPRHLHLAAYPIVSNAWQPAGHVTCQRWVSGPKIVTRHQFVVGIDFGIGLAIGPHGAT